ncbi:MAG: MBL fold metallo-hydrolase [Betaproteobacteria bacterium]|nr:MBL fold metallo-hydrolase [Betaproteobacteria bacterium]
MDFITDHSHGIFAIDSGYGRPQLDAVHLLVEDGHAALIDTAANSGVPRVMAALAAQGLRPEQVDYVILTHVHLDHAGAAGTLMGLLPNAQLLVHPRGVRHMVDPAKLLAGAVYGAGATREMYGEILPVPSARIVEAQHKLTISLNQRELLLLDTPGHARHHICIRDSRSGHIFSGDTFGLSYRELDRDGRCFIFPTTTPVQFDPAALHRSIDMLMEYQPQAIYLTHYSRVSDIPRLAADLHRLIDAHAELALRLRDAGETREEQLRLGVAQIAQEEAALQGWALQGEALLQLMQMDIQLNAQGLGSWLGHFGC